MAVLALLLQVGFCGFGFGGHQGSGAEHFRSEGISKYKGLRALTLEVLLFVLAFNVRSCV